MARQRSARTPYQWSNGTWHTRPQGKANRSTATSLGPGTAYGVPGASGPVSTAPGQKPTATGAKPKPTAPVQPLDPNVVNQQVIANRNIGLGDIQATWQQANLDQQYGFGAGGAANPYSQAAIYQENYKRDVLGTTGNYASAGQYNSGAYGRAQNENARNFDMRMDAARRAYDQASGNIQFERIRNYANAGNNVDQAQFQAIIDALRGL